MNDEDIGTSTLADKVSSQKSAVSNRLALDWLAAQKKPDPIRYRDGDLRQSYCFNLAKTLFERGLDDELAACRAVKDWSGFPDAERHIAFAYRALQRGEDPYDAYFEEHKDEYDDDEEDDSNPLTPILARPVVASTVPETVDRAALWADALKTPAEDATGTKPDYIDQRRPDGFRIIPCTCSGLVVEVIGEKANHKTGFAINEALEAVKRGLKVAYVCLEDADGVKTVRLPAACAHRGMAISQLSGSWVTWPMPIDFTDPAQVTDFMAALPFDPDLVVVDVMTKAIGDRTLNDATAIALQHGLDRIASRYGCTVLELKHPPMGDMSRGGGSSLQGNLAYARLTVKYDEAHKLAAVHVEHNKNGPAGFSVYLRNDPDADGTPVIVDVPPDEWTDLAKRKPDVAATADQPEPTGEDDEENQILAKVQAARKAIGEAGNAKPQTIKAIVSQITGGASVQHGAGKTLAQGIRRRMQRGCLNPLALRDTDHRLHTPLAFKPWDGQSASS